MTSETQPHKLERIRAELQRQADAASNQAAGQGGSQGHRRAEASTGKGRRMRFRLLSARWLRRPRIGRYSIGFVELFVVATLIVSAVMIGRAFDKFHGGPIEREMIDQSVPMEMWYFDMVEGTAAHEEVLAIEDREARTEEIRRRYAELYANGEAADDYEAMR